MKLSTTLCTIAFCISISEAYRFLAIYSLAGKSHFIMFSSLIKGLSKRGHQVDVISVLPLKEKRDNLTEILNLIVPDDYNNMIGPGQYQKVNDHPLYVIVSVSGHNMCNLLQQPRMKEFMQDLKSKSEYDGVIFHHIGEYCYAYLGELLDIPAIAVVTSAPYSWHRDTAGLPSLDAYSSNRLLRHRSSLGFSQRVYNVLYSMWTKLFFWYATKPSINLLSEVFGPGSTRPFTELQSKISLMLVNSHMSLHGPMPTVPALVEVGGLHIEEKHELIPRDLKAWLDEGTAGFVYISFGTLLRFVSLPKELHQALFNSLGKIAPVQVIIKVPNADQLPPGLPSNVRTFSWAPQLKILCHKNAKVFITHGGLLSTQEAVHCGVPVIAVPFFLDQFENADICVAKHAGVRLDPEDITEHSLDTALNLTLHDSSYSESMKKLSQRFRDRPMSALDTASYWIEYVVKHGKDSLRPEAANLAWWERDLLDAYMFLFLILSFVLYVVARLLKLLYKWLYNRPQRGIEESKKLK